MLAVPKKILGIRLSIPHFFANEFPGLLVETTFVEMFIGSFVCLSKQKSPLPLMSDPEDDSAPVPSVIDLPRSIQ